MQQSRSRLIGIVSRYLFALPPLSDVTLVGFEGCPRSSLPRSIGLAHTAADPGTAVKEAIGKEIAAVCDMYGRKGRETATVGRLQVLDIRTWVEEECEMTGSPMWKRDLGEELVWEH